MTRQITCVVAALWLLYSPTRALLPLKPTRARVVAKIFGRGVRPNILRHVASKGENGPPSTTELLTELDARKIRYSPTATRKDLMDLLESRDKDNVVDEEQAPEVPTDLAVIVQELLTKGVRIPPYATRTDLELLWLEQGQKPPTPPKRPKKQHKEIPRILKELDELCIPYPPGASPRMLQQLLRNYEGEQPAPYEAFNDKAVERVEQRVMGYDEAANISDAEETSPTKDSNEDITQTKRIDDQPMEQRQKPPTRAPRRRRKRHKEIATILKELDELGIPYPPLASPRMLEQLLRDHKNEPAQDEVFNGETVQRVAQRVTWYDKEDNVNDVEKRIPAKDSRASTKGIVQTESTNDDREAASGPEILVKSDKEMEVEPETSTAKGTADVNDVKVENHANRRDSSEQAQGSFEEFKETRAATRQPAENKKMYRPRRSRLKKKTKQSVWSKMYGNSVDSVSRKLDGATTRISRAAERAARKARHATRNAKDFLAEDENGIRDVDYEYVNKQKTVIIDVPSESSEEEELPRGTSYKRDYRTTRQARRRRPSTATRTRKERQSRRRVVVTPPRNVAATSRLFRLPPAADLADEEEQAQSSRTRRRRATATTDSNRRIYSPYDEDGVSAQAYRDSIDRLGDFFVNAADTILWGSDDETSERDTKSSKAEQKKAKAGKSRDIGEKDVNWRDRMEERFDSMLGIHEAGEYYSRWSEREESEDRDEGGYDAFSVAQGRAPKGRHRKKSCKVYDRPFWQNDNVLSSLFGRSPPDGYIDVGPGNLLPFFKSTMKSIVLLGANACEWASVRGSLPQPVVVVGVTSCVLSARPGKRLLAMALALVAFRIFGELIHEGLYGDEDWEEHDEEGDDDDHREGELTSNTQ